nr:hypothetical protein CFP56_48134 [Quercus suber]
MVVLEIDGGGIWFWWSSWGLVFTMKVGMVCLPEGLALKGGGGPKVGDSKQQDRKTNKVDSVTILWVRSAKAGLARPRGEIHDG